MQTKLKVSSLPSREHTAIHSLISWKAVIGGLLVALAINVLLMALGAGIGGAASVNIAEEGGNASGLAAGAAIWMGIAGILSLFAGGFFATRSSTSITAQGGGAHGFLVAALFFAIAFWGAGSIVGAAGKGLGSLAGAAASGADDLAKNPTVQSVIQKSLGDAQFRSAPDVVAGNLASFLLRGDEQSAKSYIASQTNLTTAEVDSRYATLKADFQARAREIAAATAKGVAAAGWTLFATMLLSLAAAILGGIQGVRANVRHPISDEQAHTEYASVVS